jgi:hypothetical protein
MLNFLIHSFANVVEAESSEEVIPKLFIRQDKAERDKL